MQSWYINITSVFILTPHWQKTTPLLTNSGDLQQLQSYVACNSDSKTHKFLQMTDINQPASQPFYGLFIEVTPVKNWRILLV